MPQNQLDADGTPFRAKGLEIAAMTYGSEVRLRVPKLRQQTFETAIIERYRRRESSVEEALIEMYLAGVSVRRVEDITEALSTNGSPIDSLYHSDNLNIFRDEFSQFWIKNGLSYIWQFHDLKGNAYVAEGKCEKTN